jgi:hypothetical protein
MNETVQWISIASSVFVILLVVQLIRRRALREDYSILWFLASLGLLLMAVDRHFIDRAAAFFGIAYPPSLLLLGAIFAGFVLAMHFSVALSRLSEQNKRLAQEVALLRLEIEKR